VTLAAEGAAVLFPQVLARRDGRRRGAALQRREHRSGNHTVDPGSKWAVRAVAMHSLQDHHQRVLTQVVHITVTPHEIAHEIAHPRQQKQKKPFGGGRISALRPVGQF
jgi:hypothetical protein